MMDSSRKVDIQVVNYCDSCGRNENIDVEDGDIEVFFTSMVDDPLTIQIGLGHVQEGNGKALITEFTLGDILKTDIEACEYGEEYFCRSLVGISEAMKKLVARIDEAIDKQKGE